VTADGMIGPVTVKALQAHVGATQDGQWGQLTTEALQRPERGPLLTGRSSPLTGKGRPLRGRPFAFP
jgi:hypothetical protein